MIIDVKTAMEKLDRIEKIISKKKTCLCPNCRAFSSYVMKTLNTHDGRVRVRMCKECNTEYATIEVNFD